MGEAMVPCVWPLLRKIIVPERDVFTMKRVLSALAAVMMMSAFGVAAAEEVPTLAQQSEQSLGIVLSRDAFPSSNAVVSSREIGSAMSGGPKEGAIEGERKGVDLGIALSRGVFPDAGATMMGESWAEGSAAGGTRFFDKEARGWDWVLGPHGSDLP